MQEIEYVNLKAVQYADAIKKIYQQNGSKKQIKLSNNLVVESIFGIMRDNYPIINRLLINLSIGSGM